MAYRKPGVQIERVQERSSTPLTANDFVPCLIGEGYEVIDPSDDVGKASPYQSSSLESVASYDNSQENTVYLDVNDGHQLDDGWVFVDILNKDDMAWHHVDESNLTIDNTDNTVVIASGIGSSYDESDIKVGFRAVNSGIDSPFNVYSQTDIEDKIGKTQTYNPLSFGASQTMINSGGAVTVYGTKEDTTDEHSTARDSLSFEEVYALTPLTKKSVESGYATHVENMSSKENGKERVAFLSPNIVWSDSAGEAVTGPNDTDMDKTETCTATSDEAFSLSNKRIAYVRPDVVYVEETRPIASVKQSKLAKVFTDITDYDAYAKFANTYTYGDTTYYEYDDITDEVWNHLMEYSTDNSLQGEQDITVYVPVPSYYLSAALVGQVSGLDPELPHTNRPIAGDFAFIKYSNDFFLSEQLDKMAAGGNWIMTQKNKSAAITTRHQQSTNATSIETREMSITEAVDFSTKFIREGVEPKIGKYNITPQFLKMIRTMLIGMGAYLRKEGVIEDLKVNTVKQDDANPDTVLVSISIAVKYPANYIDITLKF